jgi:alcohol dehydrogenase class IV
MITFVHTTLPQRVLFGSGEAARFLAEEVQRVGAASVMVIASSAEAPLATEVTRYISPAARFADVAPHVPVANAQAATAAARQAGADLLVSIGGGSTTGLAKAVSKETKIPIVAIPTTYAGSEATNVWGLTEDARKTTGVDDAVLPVSVIYDAELTAMLPAELSVVSGLNGLAHCVDSMWAPRTDPINQALAAEGIRILSQALPAIVDAAGTTLAGRQEALYGAYLSAVSFASAGSGIHHKICHVLGGAYNLPHAHTHAIVLPYVLALQAPAAPEAERRIATAFSAPTALEGLNALRVRTGAPTRLADYGLRETNIAEAVDLILPSIPPSTPRPVTPHTLGILLRAACAGDVPASEMFDQ